MRRRIDDLKQWHCSHVCSHSAQGSTPRAWRYAVVRRGYAFALTVSAVGGQFALHRAFALPKDGTPAHHDELCDLLGQPCTIEVDEGSLFVLGADELTPTRPLVNPALTWWATHAAQNQKDQPDKFWRALDAMGREWMREAKLVQRPKIKCPRCGGAGYVKESRR